jgi:phosphoglycerate kinase
LNTKNWRLIKREEQKIYSHIKAMQPGEVAILENIRFSPFEQKNTFKLAKKLAALADIFVLDGFAVAHRPDASVAGVAKYLPSLAGILLHKEVENLSLVMGKTKQPFVTVIGGVKTETKIPVIAKLLSKVNQLLVGGGIANTYFWAKGYAVGDSLVDKQQKSNIIKYCAKKKVFLPVDVIVGDGRGKNFRRVLIEKKPHVICGPGEAIYDIGPETIRLYAAKIKKANTLLWNGAMGFFEVKPYDIGTLAIARLVAYRSKGKAFGVVGGGETIEAMDRTGLTHYPDFVSTGGGAMLEFLAGKKLPGLAAIPKNK